MRKERVACGHCLSGKRRVAGAQVALGSAVAGNPGGLVYPWATEDESELIGTLDCERKCGALVGCACVMVSWDTTTVSLG